MNSSNTNQLIGRSFNTPSKKNSNVARFIRFYLIVNICLKKNVKKRKRNICYQVVWNDWINVPGVQESL